MLKTKTIRKGGFCITRDIIINMDSNESFLKKLDTQLSTGQVDRDTTRGILHRDKLKPIPDDWEDPQPELHEDDVIHQKRIVQKTFFKKIFIFACVFAVISAGAFIFSLFTGRARLSGENIQLTVNATTFADSGEEVNATVTIVNQNPVAMEFAKLIFKYPLGNTRDPNALKEITKDLGTIGAGEMRNEVFPMQLFGEQGNEKDFSAMIEYRLAGSNAIFEKTAGAKLTLRSSIATIVVNAQNNMLSGQELPIKLTISGNASSVVSNAMVLGEFPDDCSVVRSDPAPTLDTNVWYLGDLPVSSQKEITIIAKCIGLTDSDKNIQFTVGVQDEKNERKIASVYTSASHLVKLTLPFIAVDVTVEGAVPGKKMSLPQNQISSIIVNWKNTLEIPVSDAQIALKLSGEAFDPALLQSAQGYFDSAIDTILWTSNESSDLKNVGPGATGEFRFTITPRAGLEKTATLDFAASASGIITGGTAKTLAESSSVSIPISTNLQLITKTLYHSGPLKNSGPMPMQVGKKTTFTLVWQLSNTPNPASDVVVKTTLPTGVTWEDVVAPAADRSSISYNTVTREIVWNAGSVPVGQEAKTIAFTVGIIPVTGQIGGVPRLTNDISLSGIDTVIQSSLYQKKRFMETRLTGDSSNVGEDGKVKR